MTIKPLTCPKCGSPDLEEVTWNRRRCRHCGTESVLSSDRTRLQLVEWVCPSCGFNNESGTAYCGQCGAKLTKKCPECSHEIRIDLQFCNFCGANYEGVLAERIRAERREEEMERLKGWRNAQERRARDRANQLGVGLGCGAWVMLSFLLGCPLAFLASDGEGSVFIGLVFAIAIGIGAASLAIWIARRQRSQWLEGIYKEFACKRQALEESLAQEYPDQSSA